MEGGWKSGSRPRGKEPAKCNLPGGGREELKGREGGWLMTRQFFVILALLRGWKSQMVDGGGFCKKS